MSKNAFKAGDIVTRIGHSAFGVKAGADYTVLRVTSLGTITLKGLDGVYYTDRFVRKAPSNPFITEKTVTTTVREGRVAVRGFVVEVSDFNISLYQGGGDEFISSMTADCATELAAALTQAAAAASPQSC